MSAPTNTAATTATDIGTNLPYTTTQTVDDAGTTYTVWYRYTAQIDDVAIGVFGFGDLTTYQPVVSVWTGPASAPVAYHGIAGDNVPVQIGVTPGETYYFKFTTNAGNPTPAVLHVSILGAPNETVPAGSILVNDDTDGLPCVILSGTDDNTTLRFLFPFPAGEQGDILPNGNFLVEDKFANTLHFYDGSDFSELTSLSWTTPAFIRTSNAGNRFYISKTGGVVSTVTSAGAFGATTWTVATSVQALCANNAQTILYYSRGANGDPIKRWDLTNDVGLSDLVAGIGSHKPTDILVLGDDSIVFTSWKSTVTRDLNVYRYNAAGVLQNTYAFGSDFTSTSPRLAYAIDDPNSFWLWTHPSGAGDGTSKFLNIKVSDGSTLTTRIQTEYEGGAYLPAANATPVRFGNSFSCPFFILRTQAASDETIYPPSEFDDEPVIRERIFPHVNKERVRVTIHSLQLDCETGVGLTSGQGSDPQIELRISRDGGHTFGPIKIGSYHKLGKYTGRVMWRQLGQARDWVFWLRQSDPVNTAWLACYVEAEEDDN